MSKLLTFLDGATYSSLWSVGPLLISCLLFEEGDTVDRFDQIGRVGRPVSSDQALNLLSILFRPLFSPDARQVDAVAQIWKSLPSYMLFAQVAYLAGHTLGRYVGKKSSLLYSMQRVCPRRIRSLSSSRALSITSSLLASLLIINWGFGISTYAGWVTVRFLTAFVNGALVTWGTAHLGTNDSKENIMRPDLELMEEGRPFLNDHNQRAASIHKISQQMIWLDSHWLAGVASAAILSAFSFYVLNHIGPHHNIFALVTLVGSLALMDRFLSTIYFRSKLSKRSTKSGPSTFEDVGIIQITNTSTGLVNRKKKSKQSEQTHQSPLLQRTRINSISSVESDVFFDCIDDIELGFDDTVETNPLTLKSNQALLEPISSDITNQIAIYSNRKVVYSDGAPAYVPVGEKQTTIPPGYKTLYRSNALVNYQQTQQWRREQQIHEIHARPHKWYPKIKLAYPHFIHGFSKNGMPVIYESPGKMNLKQLFRNGCLVEDMIFHYCYLMEYLSNLESIQTELHSELNDECGDLWQEELAAYAHAKQQRLQNDNVTFGFVVVMDISGASPSLLSGDVMTYLSRASEINSLHYPGSMRRAIAVQAPFWLGAAWGAIKGVMPASVTVDLLSASKTKEGGLKEYINEDQIPKEYGGNSKFNLGEHPFEIGLRKLAETQFDETTKEDASSVQEMDDAISDEAWTTLLEDPPQLRQPSNNRSSSNSDRFQASTLARPYIIEWDELDVDYVLIVSTIILILSHMLIGAIELTLPLLLIIPPKQGIGFEARRAGMTLFATCLTISWILKRSRLSEKLVSITEKSPLSAFRIGLGSSGFFWLCTSILLYITPPCTSTLGLLCLSFSFTLIFFTSTLGIISASYLRKIAIASFAEGHYTLPNGCLWMQHDNMSPRLTLLSKSFGMVVAAQVIRWYIMIPITGLCFVVLACVCAFLYVLSFALHSVAPPPAKRESRRKVSQFVTAMAGLYWFLRDLVLAALGDTKFLWKELREKTENK